MSNSIHGIGSAKPVTCMMSPSLAAFVEVKNAGVLDTKLPASIDGGNWLEGSPSLVKGVGEAGAALLAAKGIKTLRQLAMTKMFFGQELAPALAKTLANAHTVIREAMHRNNID